jgi:hypothetical protein
MLQADDPLRNLDMTALGLQPHSQPLGIPLKYGQSFCIDGKPSP